MSKNLTFVANELVTAKAVGLKTIVNNVVDSLVDDTEVVIGDTYWSTSVMTKNANGVGNTKLLISKVGDEIVRIDPAGAELLGFSIPSECSACQACKLLSTDYNFGVISIDGSNVSVSTESSNGALVIANPLEADANIVAVAYRCNSAASKFCVAIVITDGSDYYLCTKAVGADQSNISFTPIAESTLHLYVNETQVALVEVKSDGNTIVRRTLFDSVALSDTVSMPTAGYTGKICDPFATKPLFYGYTSANLFKVEGADAASAILSPAVAGITGIAVFTKYGTGCESGYIYRESDAETCRDNSGKKTDNIVGTMVNNYNFNVCKMNASVVSV